MNRLKLLLSCVILFGVSSVGWSASQTSLPAPAGFENLGFEYYLQNGVVHYRDTRGLGDFWLGYAKRLGPALTTCGLSTLCTAKDAAVNLGLLVVDVSERVVAEQINEDWRKVGHPRTSLMQGAQIYGDEFIIRSIPIGLVEAINQTGAEMVSGDPAQVGRAGFTLLTGLAGGAGAWKLFNASLDAPLALSRGIIGGGGITSFGGSVVSSNGTAALRFVAGVSPAQTLAWAVPLADGAGNVSISGTLLVFHRSGESVGDSPVWKIADPYESGFGKKVANMNAREAEEYVRDVWRPAMRGMTRKLLNFCAERVKAWIEKNGAPSYDALAQRLQERTAAGGKGAMRAQNVVPNAYSRQVAYVLEHLELDGGENAQLNEIVYRTKVLQQEQTLLRGRHSINTVRFKVTGYTGSQISPFSRSIAAKLRDYLQRTSRDETIPLGQLQDLTEELGTRILESHPTIKNYLTP